MTIPTTGLITTKLNVPLLKTRLVDRVTLLDRLSAGKEHPLTVVSSVAGSGKTSLVCQWIRRDKLPVAWYSLDETDNESDLFFHYLIAALNTFGNRPISIKDMGLPGGEGSAARKVIHTIVTHFADLASDIYLVLDDYHFITSPVIHDALGYLLDHLPPKLHLVIISRYGIPFAFSRFKVRNQVTEISAADLRFTVEEIQRFFTEIIPVPLTADDIKEMTRYTEGWVGGLQLFGLSLKEKKVSDRLKSVLARANRDATDYLINEVINLQSGKVRTLLEATALLDRFNTEVAVAITDLTDAGDIIDRIYRHNLFLIPLDNRREWYRYHHLFSKAVQERVKISKPDMPGGVHRRAATWFARNGYLEDAFRSAFASGDLEFAADLLEDYLIDINDRHEYASGGRWIAKLPHEAFIQRTLLRLHDCGQKVESLQLADIEAVIKDIEADPDRAFARYEGRKRRLCEDLFIYFGYVLRYYYHDPAHADVKQLEQAFEMISPENKQFSGYIMILVSLSHIVQGNPRLADAALGKASPLIISSGSIWARSFWYRLKAVVAKMQGHLHKSDAVLREAFDYLAHKDLLNVPLKSNLHLPMAWVCYQRNELDKALGFATDAAEYGERVKFIRDMVEGNLLLALVHCARGDKERTLTYVKKMQRISQAWDAADLSVSADPWIIRIYQLLGDFQKSAQWSKERTLAMDAPFSMRLIQEHLNRAEQLYHGCRFEAARTILEELRRRCVEHEMGEAVLDIDLVLTGTMYAIKAHEAARKILEKALVFGEAEGYLRPFINHARKISPVLRELAGMGAQTSGAAHFKRVLAACGIGTIAALDRPDAAVSADGSDLTQRELEILKLMAQGYRYKEIAQKLFVSFETVKTHIKHIFKKFGVNTKLAAVRKAENLHLWGGRS